MSRTSVPFDINKKNWKNNDLFPEILYVDTNVIIDIFENRPYGKLNEDYFIELVNEHDGMIVWSKHTIKEITDFVHVNEYIALAKTKGWTGDRDWKKAENSATDTESKNIANTVITKVDSIVKYLEQFGMMTDVPQEYVDKLAKEIYLNYGGSLKDSTHVAIANLSGINDIFTHDGGFLRYPNINVYGASKNIVAGYNPNQSKAKYIDLSIIGQVSDDDEESAS